MPLFQKSVISKYLKAQNRELIVSKWKSYSNHFLSPKVQEDIRNLKEEQYQGEFLEDLFVKILGYTKPASSSETKFNLTTEYKNVKDSKKADGAIIFDDKVKAVIELKGTNTTDLGKIEVQAFGYKNNQPDCVYVITSNFEKLRFYIDNAIEHIEFNLFTLTEEEFQLLYLCLGYDNLSQNIAKKIKDESVSVEDVITKKLYKDYSLFKRELHQNLVQLNPEFEPLELFKKSQKLLDRFLFLFFGEDRHLLPPNSVRLILNQWNQLKDLDEYSPLYDRFKKYFGYLNTGYKGTQYDVFAYNGGLFKPDTILDTIKIDDNLLYSHTLKLSEYDFASEVDVNILGHIFENSLNELDEIKAQLEGAEIDKTKTKRKKDGVFYTPKYITKYIVENTVGKLCNEKKTELGIADEDYTADKKRQKKTVQTLVEKLEEYRKWLLQLTICDPACGSGAFLNQALDFLITEHQYIDELQAKLFGDGLVLSDMENSILEHNLFGVDLNEESVEIAKLSLWLRTAQPNRKLNDLNSNIKCGNSLIDEPEIAGYKAFNWQQAFPKVFEKGGFDVIIGNPPYVDSESMTKSYPFEREFISKKYKSASGNWDLFIPFFELGLNILKENGNLSFIIPNKILSASYGNTIREIINNNYSLYEIFDVSADKVFDVDVYPVTLFIKKNNEIKDLNISKKLKDSISNFRIPNPFELNWALYLNENFIFYSKIINQNIILLKNENYTISNAASVSEAYEIIEFIEDNNEINYDSFRLINTGTIDPYLSLWGIKNIVYLKKNLKYPTIKKTNIKLKSWTEKPKIIIAGMSLKIEAFYDLKNEFLPLKSTFLITSNDNESLIYLTTILNSRLINFLFRIANFANTMAGGYININKENLGNVPVKNISTSHKLPFIEKADLMLSLNKDLQEQSQKFQRTIQRKFSLEDLPKKLQDWYVLSYADFIKELAKKKVKLSLSEEAEWEDYFETESKKTQELKALIDATDKAIDKMVYELYGLSEEEIGIVEGS